MRLFKLAWRKAGPFNYLCGLVTPGQQVVSGKVSLSAGARTMFGIFFFSMLCVLISHRRNRVSSEPKPYGHSHGARPVRSIISVIS